MSEQLYVDKGLYAVQHTIVYGNADNKCIRKDKWCANCRRGRHDLHRKTYRIPHGGGAFPCQCPKCTAKEIQMPKPKEVCDTCLYGKVEVLISPCFPCWQSLGQNSSYIPINPPAPWDRRDCL